jgi:hypothetical protein
MLCLRFNHLPESARDGGLISYGADFGDIFHRAARYADRILRRRPPTPTEINAGPHKTGTCCWLGFRREREEILRRQPISFRLVVSHAGFDGESELLQEMYERGLKLPEVGTDLHAGDGMLMFWSHVPIAPWQTPEWLERCPLAAGPSPSLSASCAQAEKSLEHSVEQKSYSFANLAPQTRHIRHRLSCASVPPDFIDQKEKGISDQSEGEIDENSVFHCFPHKLVRGLA